VFGRGVEDGDHFGDKLVRGDRLGQVNVEACVERPLCVERARKARECYRRKVEASLNPGVNPSLGSKREPWNCPQ
jgi:hypothetical protein